MNFYDHVAVIAPGMSLDRRAALVAAARSLGETTSVDAELRTARERLVGLDERVPSLEATRRRVAEAEADLATERERVATLRGRLQERDDEVVASEYRAAIRELSELETGYTAALEALEAERKRARDARDTRDERIRLEDRIGNLERTAREELVASVRCDVDAAVRAAPGSEVSAFETAGAVTAALSLVRVGTVRIPVVLACRRFPDARQAERWLETPVYRL